MKSIFPTKTLKLSVLLVVVFCPLLLSAQPSMLGKATAYIKAYNLQQHGIGNFEKEGRQNDTTNYIEFIAKKDSQAHFRYYINKAGICDYFVILQPTSQMVSFISSLNENYIKIGDSEWVNKSNDLHITLTYLKGEDTFTTGFAKIQ